VVSTWFQPFEIRSGDASVWLGLTEPNSYRVVAPTQIPSPVAPGLLAKCDAALIIRSGAPECEFVVANLYRRDNGKIDQMPFGTAFYSGDQTSGYLTHHGDWDDRTFSGANAPPAYRMLTAASAVNYDQSFATLGLPPAQSGSVFDLAPKTNVDAFQRVIDEIKARET
jgi:hypothetical protein